VFDREKAFIDDKLIPLRRDFPSLKIVFEHITTKDAAQYVAAAGRADRGHDHRPPPALQPQRHLLRRLRPHYYCLPVLKRESTARPW
jgi:dihydroorotase